MEQLFEIELPKDKTSVWDNYCPVVQTPDGRQVHIFLTDAIESPSTYNEVYRGSTESKERKVITSSTESMESMMSDACIGCA